MTKEVHEIPLIWVSPSILEFWIAWSFLQNGAIASGFCQSSILQVQVWYMHTACYSLLWIEAHSLLYIANPYVCPDWTLHKSSLGVMVCMAVSKLLPATVSSTLSFSKSCNLFWTGRTSPQWLMLRSHAMCFKRGRPWRRPRRNFRFQKSKCSHLNAAK